eukprot:m.756548 g.756548  ORF g.756548 m.756548 type:complete len:109 (-) comp23184_c0_seq11:1066-1392(-)
MQAHACQKFLLNTDVALLMIRPNTSNESRRRKIVPLFGFTNPGKFDYCSVQYNAHFASTRDLHYETVRSLTRNDIYRVLETGCRTSVIINGATVPCADLIVGSCKSRW